MFQIKINKRLLPIKFNYIFTFGTMAPVIGFLPTIARQLGYSIATYGTVMMCISMMTMPFIPLSGIAAEKFHFKKKLYFTLALLVGVFSLSLLFVPKVPLNTTVKLACDTENMLIVYAEIISPKSLNQSVLMNNDTNESVACKLNCQDSMVFHNKSFQLSNLSEFTYNNNLMTTTQPAKIHHSNIEISFKLKDMKNNNGSYGFRVNILQVDSLQTFPKICQWLRNSNTFCNIVTCSDETIINLVTTKSYKGNLINLYQFWMFFFIALFFSTFSTMMTTLQNPICLDILGDKPEDFGKQKCWGSIGWGFFAIFIGWLVDRISVDKKEKDYSPVFYSAVLLTCCNLISVYKIKVVETKKTRDQPTKVYGLFSKRYVVAFFIWSAFNTFFHTIITHFLFWYMEDLVSENNDPGQRAWIKTLQGLAQGIQCFGGEIPFFFWSGWIINTMGGHVNCMALVLGAMALRMYLYTVIWNPVWIVAIELLNGVSYALGFAVKMSYAKTISPPGTIYTMIGLLGFTDMMGDSLASLLGGYLFGTFGGVWSFRFFAFSSGLMCLLNVLSNIFRCTKDVKNSDFLYIPTTSINKNENENVVVKN